MLGYPLVVGLQSVALRVGHFCDKARDVGEGVYIGSLLVGSIERSAIVGGLLFLEESQEAILRYHQHVVGYFEGLILVVVVDALEIDFCSHDRVVIVAAVDVVDRQCHLRIEACRSLDVGAGVVVGQLLQKLLLVADFRGLQHFLGSCQGDTGLDDGVLLLVTVVHADTHLDRKSVV